MYLCEETLASLTSTPGLSIGATEALALAEEKVREFAHVLCAVAADVMFEQKQYHAAAGWYQRNCDRPGTDIEDLEVTLRS